MAKVTGTQNVPSSLLDLYRATLGEQDPENNIGKRYPFRVPPMQTEKGHPTAKQLAQRSRFKTALADFANESASSRARWYAAEPPWSSFLWYYNYYIMSDLMGNANIEQGGAGVIKSLLYYTYAIPNGAPADVNVVITEVDAAKTVVMLFGAGKLAVGIDAYVPVYPYPKAVTATQLTVRASMANEGGFDGSAIVIEYI